MRWWKLACVAAAGILTLAAATWATFWIRPPDPAHLITLLASYDNALAIPANPYGKGAAGELADLTKPGAWLGGQSRIRGSAKPTRLTRIGLPGLTSIREKCIVAVIAAHGGRDREGAFLFPEDASADPQERVRVKAIVDRLAKLPARTQKLLILDATELPAFAELGLVHNDFAGGILELEGAIAAVPNLAVYASSGLDQQSWVSPEWGQSAFLHYILQGLRGGADSNRDKRITAGELVDYVGSRVRAWARDHRGALQTPVLLPKGDEGRRRIDAMHLASTDGPVPEEAAPVPFEPPPQLEEAWQDYRSLAAAYPPPTAYTPHLWKQFEAWTLRYERALVAGDLEGANIARSKALDLKREIEATRRLELAPQTLSIQVGLGGLSVPTQLPDSFRSGMEQFAALPALERPTAWPKAKAISGFDGDASRLLWCRALVEWVAVDPLSRLSEVPSLVSFVSEGMPIRPAEINFLLALAQNLPPTDKTETIGPLLKRVLFLRLQAESSAELTASGAYPFPEWLGLYSQLPLSNADKARRTAEDLCFATSSAHWQKANSSVEAAERAYAERIAAANAIRDLIAPWHRSMAELPAVAEWLARGSSGNAFERLSQELQFQAWRGIWGRAHEIAAALPSLTAGSHPEELEAMRIAAGYAADGMRLLNDSLAGKFAKLLAKKPEFEARPTPRTAVVEWWHAANDVLTAPLPDGTAPATRIELVREFRRVSRQLLIVGQTLPEPLPEPTPEIARERAFEAARKRGFLILDRLHEIDVPFQKPQRVSNFPQELVVPGTKPETPEFRLDRFAFQADDRRSLAEASSRCGELLAAAAANAANEEDPLRSERWLRLAPAHAAISDAPLDRHRRERIAAILAAQAQRTYLDYWYGESGTRYYRTAIEQLAADARKLGAKVRADLFQRYLGSEPPFPVVAAAPTRFIVTDEPKPELKISFAPAPPPEIDGVPVFWMSPNPKSEARLTVPLRSRTETPILTRNIARPTTPPPAYPVREGQPVQIAGFFRGRSFEKSVPVDIYRLPDRVAATSSGLSSTAVALRADPRIRARYGFGTGAVSVVLDCSGSLGPTDRKNPLDRGLYATALKALDVLLHELPPGTILNVWVFGERMDESQSPEGTIREILPPTQLPYDAKPILDKVVGEAASLEPWNLSPIVRAAFAARDRIQDEDVPFKAVVLISDGVDTRYDADQKNLKKRSVKDALRAEFANGDVSLSILALPADKSEAAFQAEFSVVGEIRPAGKFIPVPKDRVEERVRELTAWLRNGLNPRVRFSLSPLDGQGSSGDLSAGTDLADNWYRGRLEPGTYRFQMSGAKEVSHSVQLNRGDRLLLDLTEDRDAIELRRHWFADTATGVKSGKPSDPWRLTLLQNRSDSGGLQLFTAIEERPQAMEPISVSRLGEAWYELRPVLPNPAPVAARWRPAPGFPSPCWSIDVPGWPVFPGSKAAASPLLEAWWSTGEPFSARGIWRAPIGTNVSALEGQTASFGDASLTLHSVGIESQFTDGKTEAQKCLVVRLSHPPGNPVWVRPHGASLAGSEIRTYREANKVTCVFWGVDAAQFVEFDVVVLNDALRSAERLGLHAILDNVPGPTDSAPRPEPPVELR